MKNTAKIITIDGPAGAGKSTIAKKLAKELKIAYLDTGAMYRAITLKAIRNKLDLTDEGQLASLAASSLLDISTEGDSQKILLDGEDITWDIRSEEVTKNTRYIANAPKVREIVTNWQRNIGSKQSIVMEGRDIGTVVFPRAQFKFYLDADIKERAKRRLNEVQANGQSIDQGQLEEDLTQRDKNDISREVSPLRKADDAIIIDSTDLSIEEVVKTILGYIHKDGKVIN